MSDAGGGAARGQEAASGTAEDTRPHVLGSLRLRLDPAARGGVLVECTIQDDIVTMARQRPGTPEVVIVRVHTSMLIVKLLPDFPCIFSASGRDTPNEIVYCFAESESKRNEWLAVLRRMGVSIYDSSGNVVLPDTTVVHSRSDAASDRSTPRERSTAAAEGVRGGGYRDGRTADQGAESAPTSEGDAVASDRTLSQEDTRSSSPVSEARRRRGWQPTPSHSMNRGVQAYLNVVYGRGSPSANMSPGASGAAPERLPFSGAFRLKPRRPPSESTTRSEEASPRRTDTLPGPYPGPL